MIRFLSNMPIFRRLIIVFAVTTLAPGLVIVLLGNFYITSLSTQGQAVTTSFDAQSLASQEETNLQRMNALLQAKFYQIFASHSDVVTDPSLFASGGLVDGEIRALEADFDRSLPIYQQNYELATSNNMTNVRTILLNDDATDGNNLISSQENALNNVIGENKAWATYQQYQDQELNKLEALQSDLQNGVIYTPVEINQKYQADYKILHSSTLAFTDLKNNWQQVVDNAVSMGKAVTSVGMSQEQPIFIATALALIFTLLVIIAAGIIIDRTITRPLRQLASLTERIADGNTSARAVVGGRDEISKVANAMNNMLNNIVRLIQETQRQRDSLQGQVEKLVSEVSGVGEGDLRIQAEVTTDALGALADSFNYMVEELSSLVVRVKTMAYEVGNSTGLTFERMVQLVENADREIQQIGKAAREVEQMAASSRQVAERAQALYGIARDARRAAQAGRESVQQTVEGMGRIQTYVQDTAAKVQVLGDSSREIDNIVGVISTIAHQTNRLALDAAVQAATAGENGKGFGVVASDIRRLSERAKDQAGQIARIVRVVSENIGAATISMQDTERETSVGARLAEETGQALESIFNVVERQGQEVEIINQMTTHQLQSSNTVVQIMQGVSVSTQQGSISTREAAQNLERMTRLAEQLLNSVGAFKLRDNVDYFALSGVTMPSNSEYGNLMAMGEVYRTVTSSNQPSQMGQYGNQRTLPPGPMTPKPAYTPVPNQQPYQQNAPIPNQQPYQQNAPIPNQQSYQQRNSTNTSGPLNQNQQRNGTNTSGPLNQNQQRNDPGSGGSQNWNPQGNGNGSSGPLNQNQDRQNKLRQNRLQRPPAPPEK